MTALAYIRVSSRAPDHASQSSAIEHVAAARGEAIEDWRVEKRGAKTAARDELQRLLADASAGRLRGRRLYIFRLDRLMRTGIADTLVTLDELRAGCVDVVSVEDGLDLAGPHAEAIVAIMVWAAKMDRVARAERIAAARERIEADGGHWGRPRRMGKVEVARAFDMRAAGHSVRAIARSLHVPRSTVARALAETVPEKPVAAEGAGPARGSHT